MKDNATLSAPEMPGILSKDVGAAADRVSAPDATVDRVFEELKQNGVVVLPPLLPEAQISEMRRAFEARMGGVRWNDLEGYEREPLSEPLSKEALDYYRYHPRF